jgi:hypothetical protein
VICLLLYLLSCRSARERIAKRPFFCLIERSAHHCTARAFETCQDLVSSHLSDQEKSPAVPGVSACAASFINRSLMPVSLNAPTRVPDAAPNAVPSNGARKINPMSLPQNTPTSLPGFVSFTNWLTLTRPFSSLTAITASPSSIRYFSSSARTFSRTSSALYLLGNAMKTRSLMTASSLRLVSFIRQRMKHWEARNGEAALFWLVRRVPEAGKLSPGRLAPKRKRHNSRG